MMRVSLRTVSVLLVALACAGAALWLASRSLQADAMSRRQVVVAAHDLEPGAVLQVDSVKLVDWPVGPLPQGVVQDLNATQGRVLRTALYRDEPVMEVKLAAHGAKAGLSAVIAPGRRAMTVKVNEVVGVAGFALPGSHVDVMVHTVREDATGKPALPVSRIVLERILVLAVAQESRRDEERPKLANAVTLEVTPDQAELLDVARSVGQLSLVLRSPADAQLSSTSGKAKPDLWGGESVGAPSPGPTLRPARSSTPRDQKAAVERASAPPSQPSVAASRPQTGSQVEVFKGLTRVAVEVRSPSTDEPSGQ